VTRTIASCAAVAVLVWRVWAASVGAADVAGKWKMSYTTPEGVKMANVLTLTVEGDKLAGTVSSARGTVPVDEITIKGEEIAFAVIRVGFGDKIRIDYTGKIVGNTMTLKMKVGTRDPIDVTATREG
jgi:hypothetical protein